MAGASGLIPSWISGLYGAELWALLQAASYASPGSPLYVDCNAVKVGVHNGLRWAQSSSRKLARVWIPLANILEDCTDSVAWLPAHCSESAVGDRELSNGRKFDMVDLTMNALVDTWAKSEASSAAPSRCDIKVVEKTTDLVDCLARWIGLCTREANHFPAPEHFESVKFIRDTTASSRRSAKAKGGSVPSLVAAVKREAPSSVSISFVPALSSTCDQFQAERACVRDSFSLAKRAKLSCKQADKKVDAVFREHWHERKRLAPALSSPPVSAAVRLEALRARIVARSLS